MVKRKIIKINEELCNGCGECIPNCPEGALQVIDGKVIGVLNCFTFVPHQFSQTEVNLITAVANQAAVAILNTELMVKTKVIQEELETRKLLERAKEIITRRKKLKSDEAFRWIQKRSMDTRKSIRNIAEAILLSEELD